MQVIRYLPALEVRPADNLIESEAPVKSDNFKSF